MIWKQAGGRAVDAEIVKRFEDAAKEFAVPVGILLGTVERESNFRLGLVSSAGAVGPCQFKRKFAEDYYRYAGFRFDLEGWDSVRGMAAIYGYYARLGAKRHGYTGVDGWRYALCAHRWGQNSAQAKRLERKGRVSDVEAAMRRNGVWYTEDGAQEDKPAPDNDAANVAAAAVRWALDKLGYPYSQPKRATATHFDCSSLVARAYAAQGVPWELVGTSKLPTSNYEVYSDQFELLWPSDYSRIGKTFGGADVLHKADQPGDLQFLCTNRRTGRSNKITHVTMVADAQTIVHARGTAYGVRKDYIRLYAGKVCAVLRYNPDAPLRKGMRGLRVKALQQRLGVKADGIFGIATEAAARKAGL